MPHWTRSTKYISGLIVALACTSCVPQTSETGAAPSRSASSFSGSSPTANAFPLALAADQAGNSAEAIRLFEEVDRTGGGFPAAVARFRLGTHYQAGVGVPQDYAAAARWYSKSIDLTPPDIDPPLSVYLQLGALYFYGDGVPRNPAMARTLWAKIPVGSRYIRLMNAGLLPKTLDELNRLDAGDAVARLESGRPQKTEEAAAEQRRKEAEAAELRRWQAEQAALPPSLPQSHPVQAGHTGNFGICLADSNLCESSCVNPFSPSTYPSDFGSALTAGNCKSECSDKFHACMNR
jgi:hypothetical protein